MGYSKRLDRKSKKSELTVARAELKELKAEEEKPKRVRKPAGLKDKDAE